MIVFQCENCHSELFQSEQGRWYGRCEECGVQYLISVEEYRDYLLQRDIPGTVFCIPNNVPTEPVEWPDGSRHMEYYWWTFTEPYPLHNIQIGYGNRYVYLDPYFMGAARDPGLSVQQNLNTQFMVWEAFREVARKLNPTSQNKICGRSGVSYTLISLKLCHRTINNEHNFWQL